MISRMIGCALLRPLAYEEVEADRSATFQAMAVVIAGSLAFGIWNLAAGGAFGLLLGVVDGLVGWAIWAFITYFVGTTLFRAPETQANWGELARTLGFAHSPRVFLVLGFVPGIGLAVLAVVSIWTLVATVIAIRQALDYRSTWRAVGVAVVVFIGYALFSSLVRSVL